MLRRASPAAALARTSSTRERARTAAAQALAAGHDQDTARCAVELAAVRDEMLAVRAVVDDTDAGASLGLANLHEVEVLLLLCSLLHTKDLGRLACVCRTFGGKVDWHSSAVGEPPRPQERTTVEEMARRWVLTRPAKQQATVAHWSGWLRRMHEIQTPAAVFSRSASSASQCEMRRAVEVGYVRSELEEPPATIELVQHGSVAIKRGGVRLVDSFQDEATRTAASAVTMRDGRHYANFTVLADDDNCMFFGLIRPGWDVGGGGSAEHADGHCFYWTDSGQCWLNSADSCAMENRTPTMWEGMQDAKAGDTIGLLLDFTTTSLTVFKNGERLGVMATGLRGEYCWAVSLQWPGDSARIESAPAPTGPTAAEVAVAVDFRAATFQAESGAT